MGDLRLRPNTHRRAPIACALADIDVQLLVAMQAGNEGLLQAHKMPPWPELPAVGMAR